MTTTGSLPKLGVEHICGYPPGPATQWTAEHLIRYREYVESFGLTVDMIPLPLEYLEISDVSSPNIMLGKSPERDREIEGICEIIRACAAAGIPGVQYYLTILGILSTDGQAGPSWHEKRQMAWRGGSNTRAFVYERAKQEPPLTNAGRVDADTM